MFRMMSKEEVKFLSDMENKGYRVGGYHYGTFVAKMENGQSEMVLTYSHFDSSVIEKGNQLSTLN